MAAAALGLAAILSAGFAAAASERDASVQRAEAALAGGNAAAAVEAFEGVAATGHGADGESGLVRAYMQAGRYRQALAFGAHVAGEHFDEPGAGILYAWLLRVGGQTSVAAGVLAETAARFPNDSRVIEASQCFAAPVPIATGALLAAPYRTAPMAWSPDGSEPPRGARVVAGAVLIDAGTRALMPRTSGLQSGTAKLWVRDGLGATRRAEIDPADAPSDDRGVLVLRLIAPLADGAPDGIADRDPFAGSPAYAAEYSRSPDATPAWPQLRQGFVGAFVVDRPRPLAIELGGAPGGPVFDAAGALIGMVVDGADGRPLLLPVSMWPRSVRSTPAIGSPAASPRARAAAAADQVYERALRITLQVIADR